MSAFCTSVKAKLIGADAPGVSLDVSLPQSPPEAPLPPSGFTAHRKPSLRYGVRPAPPCAFPPGSQSARSGSQNNLPSSPVSLTAHSYFVILQNHLTWNHVDIKLAFPAASSLPGVRGAERFEKLTAQVSCAQGRTLVRS